MEAHQEKFNINSFISSLKNYVKKKDKTFEGKIDSDYLQSYKSSLIKNSELTLKYCFSILQNIIIKENEIYEDKDFLTGDIKFKLLDLIDQTLSDELSFFDFCKKLFLISKEIKCIFKISILITKIFKIEFLYNYDYFCFFIFKNNFKNGLDLLNGMDSICNLPPFQNDYNYKNFIEDIRNKYNNYENEEECYIKVFKSMSNDENLINKYIEQIREKKGKYEDNKNFIIELENKKLSKNENFKTTENKIELKNDNKFIEDENEREMKNESKRNKKKKRKKK